MAASDPVKAEFLPRFFKTGKGQYGYGDRFLGVVVPKIRKVANSHSQAAEEVILRLLASPYHEERLTALLILVEQFRRGGPDRKREICELYLSHTRSVNNWDLVDLSAPIIVGEYLYGKDTAVLSKLARSSDLWERRIAMLATFAFIKRGESNEALEVAGLLVQDTHDLIHKAVGWMLRETGKRCSIEVECHFLDRHAATMPRTMLRYAIERFPGHLKKRYMEKKIAPALMC